MLQPKTLFLLISLSLAACVRTDSSEKARPDSAQATLDSAQAADNATNEALFDVGLFDAGPRDLRTDEGNDPDVGVDWALVDGPKDAPPTTCPAICNGGCASGVCRVIGGAGDVVCPPTMPCTIDCTEQKACLGAVICGDGACEILCGGGDYSGQCEAIDCSTASSCLIHCMSSGNCTDTITCGPGTSCVVECLGGGACQGAIDCQADECDIRCLGSGSCQDTITCGSGRCSVTCGDGNEDGQCMQTIDCSASCACDVACIGLGSCDGDELCPSGCAGGTGCDSSLPNCDSCT